MKIRTVTGSITGAICLACTITESSIAATLDFSTNQDYEYSNHQLELDYYKYLESIGYFANPNIERDWGFNSFNPYLNNEDCMLLNWMRPYGCIYHDVHVTDREPIAKVNVFDLLYFFEDYFFADRFMSIDPEKEAFVFRSSDSTSFITIDTFPCGIHHSAEEHHFEILVGEKKVGGIHQTNQAIDFGRKIRKFNLLFPEQNISIPVKLEKVTSGGKISIHSRLGKAQPIPDENDENSSETRNPQNLDDSKGDGKSVPEPSLLWGLVLLGGAGLLRKIKRAG